MVLADRDEPERRRGAEWRALGSRSAIRHEQNGTRGVHVVSIEDSKALVEIGPVDGILENGTPRRAVSRSGETCYAR